MGYQAINMGTSAPNDGETLNSYFTKADAMFAELYAGTGTVSHAITDVASAATCDIGAAATDRIRITGSVTITSFGTSANKLRFVHFDAALTLTYNATTLILPDAANKSVEAGDAAIFSSDASGNWRCLNYYSADDDVDSSDVTFTQSGTGAVERTALAKMRDAFNVLDFIPVALHAAILDKTSTTDVATYIQAAIDAIDKGTLWFPRGNYQINSTIAVRKGVLLLGDGKGHQHDVGSADYATRLVWGGAALGQMIAGEPTNGASAQRISGGGVVGIGLYGLGVAGGGLSIRSWNDGVFDLHAEHFAKTVKNITGITQANPAVVTSAAHGFSNNDVVLIRSVGGMTELNLHRYVVAGVTTNTFQLQGINSTGYGAYTSGGTAATGGYAVYVGVTSGTLGEAKDAQFNHFKLSLKQTEISTEVGPCLFLDGASIAVDGNASKNVFEHVLAIHKYDNGIICGNSDNNYFQRIGAFDFSGGSTLYGVELLGGASASVVSGQQLFGHTECVGGLGFVARGTGIYPVAATGNKIEFWDHGNAAPDYPVSEAGAEIVTFVAGATGSGIPLWDMGQAILDQKLLVYRSGNDRFGFGMAAGQMRAFAASNAKLSLGTVSTADGTTYTEVGHLDSGGITASNATGLGILDSNSTHDLRITTSSNLTADRLLTLVPGDAARTVTISGDPTISQDYSATGSPTFAAVTLGNTGLHVLDTNATHYLTFVPGSNLTANRVLTVTTGDADRTVTLNGNPTLDDWFDQSVKVAASPTFAAVTASGLSRGSNFLLGAVATGSMAPHWTIRISAVNFNSANTDNAITITLPTGFTRYRFNSVIVSGASASLTTATFGVFTAAAGAGTALIASGTACTVSTASESTVNNAQLVNGTAAATTSFTETTLYFRVQTPQGSAATANVTMFIQPLS